MSSLNDEERVKVLSSLTNVGQAKAVGYLPIGTISNLLLTDVEVLAKTYQDKGLSIRIFATDECCIKSGAIYVYSKPDLQLILNDSWKTLVENGWVADADQFIDRIAKVWLPESDPIYAVIQKMFGEGCI